VAAPALVGEDVTEIRYRILHDLQDLDNSWHEQMLDQLCESGQNATPSNSIFTDSLVKLQNSS
jgi:hypothetical protein